MTNTDATKSLIEGTKGLRWFEDGIPELEEQLAEALDLAHFPDDEDYDGPTMVDADGNGYAIVVSVEKVDEHGALIR